MRVLVEILVDDIQAGEISNLLKSRRVLVVYVLLYTLFLLYSCPVTRSIMRLLLASLSTLYSSNPVKSLRCDARLFLPTFPSVNSSTLSQFSYGNHMLSAETRLTIVRNAKSIDVVLYKVPL